MLKEIFYPVILWWCWCVPWNVFWTIWIVMFFIVRTLEYEESVSMLLKQFPICKFFHHVLFGCAALDFQLIELPSHVTVESHFSQIRTNISLQESTVWKCFHMKITIFWGVTASKSHRQLSLFPRNLMPQIHSFYPERRRSKFLQNISNYLLD
jgi:hypothetical protein